MSAHQFCYSIRNHSSRHASLSPINFVTAFVTIQVVITFIYNHFSFVDIFILTFRKLSSTGFAAWKTSQRQMNYCQDQTAQRMTRQPDIGRDCVEYGLVVISTCPLLVVGHYNTSTENGISTDAPHTIDTGTTVPTSTSRDMEVRYNRIYRSDTRVCQDTPTVPVEICQFKAVHGRGL